MPPNEPSPSAVPGWQRVIIGRSPKRALIRALLIAGVAFVVFKFFLLPVRIKGVSMEPTYHDGGVNLINRLAYRWGMPQRGDVVAIKTTGLHIMYFKRIIGLPGETVAITNGIVLLNGQPFNEPYVRERAPWQEPARKLGADEFFVIGDNRGMLASEHEHGGASLDHIVGKVLW